VPCMPSVSAWIHSAYFLTHIHIHCYKCLYYCILTYTHILTNVNAAAAVNYSTAEDVFLHVTAPRGLSGYYLAQTHSTANLVLERSNGNCCRYCCCCLLRIRVRVMYSHSNNNNNNNNNNSNNNNSKDMYIYVCSAAITCAVACCCCCCRC